MNVGRIFFFLFFMGTAGAFGCGMRGTVIKNAKGAMLPGAIVGTVLALFSGSSFLENNYYLLAGMGAAVMYFAGNMSCAQTVSLSEPDKEKSDRQRGIFGVWLKGTICCGLFASCVSVFISVLSGGYTLTEIILFIIFMPVSAVLFCFIFNRPFNPEKNKFPRIYLSAGDPEIWGGLLGVLLETVIFSCIVKDWGAVVMTASSMVFGGLSSLFALFLYIRTAFPDKKGRKFFGDANINGLINSQKILECAFGAASALGIAVTYILAHSLFEGKLQALDNNGMTGFTSERVSQIAAVAYCVLLAADCIQYFIPVNDDKKYQKRLLKNNLITKETYEENLKKLTYQPTEKYLKYKNICEKCEFAVYGALPLLLMLLGCGSVAEITSFTVILLVLCREYAGKFLINENSSPVIKFFILLPSFVLAAVQIISGRAYNIRLAMLLYTVIYEGGFLLFNLTENRHIQLDQRTVHGYFLLCCIALNLFLLLAL